MNIKVEVHYPTWTRKEALEIYEKALQSYPNNAGVQMIVGYLREIPDYAKVRVKAYPLNGGYEIRRVDRKRKGAKRI